MSRDYPEDMYLTDEQYLQILLEIRDIVNSPDFEPHFHDSNAVGDKYNESNCGLCNDEGLCNSKDRALFPKLWPNRKTLKYSRNSHICPFQAARSSRKGCFYSCALFQEHITDVEKLKKLVDNLIKEKAPSNKE